jgi:hypothetical protein
MSRPLQESKLANLDLNLLVSLDALLQERSVSRAAARLGLNQPSLSGSRTISPLTSMSSLTPGGGTHLDAKPRVRPTAPTSASGPPRTSGPRCAGLPGHDGQTDDTTAATPSSSATPTVPDTRS